MRIVIADVNELALKRVSDELTGGGSEAMSMVVDVSNHEQVAELADATYARFGNAHTAIVSDRETTLKDGTPANEGVLEYRASGGLRIKVLGITVVKDDRWVMVVIGTPSASYSEELMEILHSLEFHS